MKRIPQQLGILAVSLGLAAFAAAPASASHSWGNYHWYRTSNPFTVKFGNNLVSSWKSYLTKAASDWGLTSGSCNNPGNPVRCSVVTGSSSSCGSVSNTVQVCNGLYGNTGWVGIAGISVSGSHITSGYVKMNDTYFNTPTYNTPDWRQLVMSQEVGHALGLDHQDTNNYNADKLDACGRGSCMDYSSTPANQTTPNQHDYDQLVTIYGHIGAPVMETPLVAADGPVDNIDWTDASNWGVPVRFEEGRPTLFERDLGAGRKQFTFVTWAQ